MWRVFEEGPGELDGDDALLAFIERRFDGEFIDEWDEFAALGWAAGHPQLDHPFIVQVLEFAWTSANDEALRGVASGSDYVMHRLADLAVKGALSEKR